MAFLELKNISKSFGGARVIDNVNLTIEEGEFVAIVGYSGSGKTTLVSLVAGLLKPDTGTITLDGKLIDGPGPERGLVFQNYSLLPWLTVRENIAVAVDSVFAEKSAEERHAHVTRFIEMVKLGHASDRLPRQLSGGMRQRVAVARTLAIQPRILLLDEPLSALDALTRATLQDEITQIRRTDNTTILLITNSVDEALLLADRVISLTPGPGATLAEPFTVDLPRPRDRKTLNHEPFYKQLRARITEQLLSFNASRKTTLTKKLILPDILPEDLDAPRVHRPPRRPGEIKETTVASV